ncbi:MAG: LTA synthase family protein [Clostridia bacterium]|nr:LTA synthase family protein [Clostridia bacterium]
MKNIIKHIIMFIIILFSFALLFTVNWLYKTFGNLTLEEVVFQLKVPMVGTNADFYFDYAKNVLPYILISTIASFSLLCFIFKKKKYKKPKAKRMKGSHADPGTSLVVYKKFRIDTKFLGKMICSFAILTISLVYTTNRTNLTEFLKYQWSNSDLIENEYVDVSSTNIEFSENKRNLIYIYLESMEATFFSKENGGAYDESIIPELEQLAVDNISFTCSDKLAGLYSLPGTTWTTGAMTAQTTGLPLKIPIEGNSYGEYDSFLPGVTSLGQILKDEGYKQMLMIGSNAEFGGREHLFKQHGDYEIYDFSSAVAEEKRTKDDFVWWGYPDRDLFEYAKEKLTLLGQEEQPFNFTMLTADTHHVDGFPCEDCEEKFDQQYFNVLACSSKKVKEFVDWIQEQDFYENTTIIICGDHPSMQPETFTQIENEGYIRTVYNVIINSAVETENTKNKNCTTIDMFPTTLASMGVKIEGEKLGLGTNLLCDKDTLMAKYGLEYLKEELNKNSRFYNKKFIYENK